MNQLITILTTLTKCHDKFYDACVSLYMWVDGVDQTRDTIVDILVSQFGFDAISAEQKMVRYLDFGSGDINPAYFELSPGIRSKLSGFSKTNINTGERTANQPPGEGKAKRKYPTHIVHSKE